MARLARVLQKIFGQSAGFEEIAQYGSLSAGTPVFTTNISTIQALSNYLGGWYDGVVGSNSPAIEDMNALFYLITTQLAYLFEEGVPEWDATTTYYTGSLVQTSGIMYVSLIDTNLNQAVTDTTKWFTPTQNGMVCPNTIPSTRTVPANKTLTWSAPTIGSGVVVTVPSNARFAAEGSVIITGTGNLLVTGTGVARVY